MSPSIKVRSSLTAGVLWLAFLALAAPASGAITVNNANDSGAGSLRQTVAEAPPGETIVLPAGTYTLTSAPLAIAKSVTIAGHGAGDTIVRSGGAFRVLELAGPLDATLSDLTIRDGNVSSYPLPALGGGIYSVEANLTLTRVNVIDNRARTDGGVGQAGGVAEAGGIFFSQGKLRIVESTVSGNAATALGGSGAKGGVAVGGGMTAEGTVEILNSTIAGNLADARGGQGPSNAGQEGGLALDGGIVFGTEGMAPSTISGSTISGNVADASAGPGGTPLIAEAGGGSVSTVQGPILLSNVTVASNVARALGEKPGGILLGGGLLGNAEPPGKVEILASTISANRNEGSTPTFWKGGDVYAGKNVSFGDTIVANGSGGEPGTENCGTKEATSLGFNIDSLDQCGFHAAGDQINTAPQLGPLQLNGGLTEAMAPALGSPAIDSGRAFGNVSDQRGVIRPIDLPTIPNALVPGADGADIGAVELRPSNAFSLGKLSRNKKKGTAKLAVILPQPSAGTLALVGKGLVPQTMAITGQTEVKLNIVGKKAVKRALRKRGKRKVRPNVTYAPTGNSALTQSRTVKLVKKRRKRHRKNHHNGANR